MPWILIAALAGSIGFGIVRFGTEYGPAHRWVDIAFLLMVIVFLIGLVDAIAHLARKSTGGMSVHSRHGGHPNMDPDEHDS